MRHVRLVTLAAGLTLTLAAVARADNLTGYKIQPIVKLGDTVANLKIRASDDFEFGFLNDAGQFTLVTENQAGGEMLLEYSNGSFLPIVVGGGDAPGGKWPRSVGIASPVQMNQQGDVVFATDSTRTYRWDHQSGQVSVVAAPGMPAVNDLVFTAGGDPTTAAINDYGEIAFQGAVKDTAGKIQRGIFFLGQDGKLLPVLLAGQEVAGVGPAQPASQEVGSHLSLNNAGVVAFQAPRVGDKADSVFLWENGTVTPVVLAGADAPGGGKFVWVGGAQVNNKNQNVLVSGNLDGISKDWGIYMLTAGHLIAVCVHGQEMPGGGQFRGVAGGSFASRTGENAFIARLEGGDTAAYRIDADGKLSLIIKSGMITDLGTIASVVPPTSTSMGLNGKGQVALPVRFAGESVDTILLLTPTAP